MPLAAFQQQLELLYDVHLEQQVDDYLVTDPRWRTGVADAGQPPSAEQLLFHQDDDELLVSLYLDQALVDEMRSTDPFQRLDPGLLASFCTVLEGVSHFVYLVYNAGHERPVSLLELELQAEVDKFFVVSTLSARQGRTLHHGALVRWLFDHCTFDPALDAPRQHRYRQANRLARAFCARAGDGAAGEAETVRELRRFYRKRHRDKLHSALSGGVLRAP